MRPRARREGMRLCARALASWSVLLSLAWSAVASAANPIRFEYQAFETCPDRETFLGWVSDRNEMLRVVDDERAPQFRVTFSMDGAEVIGALDVSGDGEVRHREMRGTTCVETAYALALVVALAASPEQKPAAPLVSVPPIVPPVTELPPARAAPSRPPVAWAWQLGLTGLVASAVAPRPSFGGAFFVELVSESRSIVAPSFRLSALALTSPSVSAGPGTARFALAGGSIDACPLRLELGDLRGGPCVAVDVGALLASGEGVDHPKSGNDVWVSADALLRLEWLASRPVVLGLEGGLLVPITRHRFFFDSPPTVVHEIPSVGARAGVTVALRFL